jgi:hypothetical protein
VTRKGPAPLEAYESHLRGDVGLGLVPVRLDGTCLFGVIDIDIDDIDHVKLYEAVTRLNLPLNVCRSKSGGAHLYAFFRQPTEGAKVQLILKRWSVALGHPKAEIFPKQTRIDTDNVGNWINLPYFGSELTTRYAVREQALSLKEFLDSTVYTDGKVEQQVKPASKAAGVIGEKAKPREEKPPSVSSWNFSDGPPCLQKLASAGVPQGGRNSLFFNIGVYLRKSKGDDYAALLEQANKALGQPPLDEREIRTIAKSLSKATYRYTCNSEPIASCCDKPACLRQKYGVGHTSDVEDGGYAAFEPSNLRKILTDPPHYCLQVNGLDVKLELMQLTNFSYLRHQVISQLDIVIPVMKQSNWDQVLHTLLVMRVDVPAPLDASPDGLILEKVFDFLETRTLATSSEDLLRGLPVQDETAVLFRAADLRKFLQLNKLTHGVDHIFTVVQRRGCKVRHVKVAGKLVEAWAFPIDGLNEQTEDFAVPAFKFDEEL